MCFTLKRLSAEEWEDTRLFGNQALPQTLESRARTAGSYSNWPDLSGWVQASVDSARAVYQLPYKLIEAGEHNKKTATVAAI